MLVLETERLTLRRLDLNDAEFILGLLNQPSFVRYIGDKGVRTLEDARNYLVTGPLESYRKFGFGLYLLSLRAGGASIGICGLLKRDTLMDVDVGFALLPQYAGYGYATESARAVLVHGREKLGLGRIVGITAPDNHGSIAVLEKIGLRFEGCVVLGNETSAVRLYGS